MGTIKSYRMVMGEQLKAFRIERGLTAYAVARDGDIRISQVNAVESGLSSYTIDTFLGYIKGASLYMYFGEKADDRQLPHNFDDLTSKAVQNNPRL